MGLRPWPVSHLVSLPVGQSDLEGEDDEAALPHQLKLHGPRELPVFDSQAKAGGQQHDVAGVVVQQVQEDDRLAEAVDDDGPGAQAFKVLALCQKPISLRKANM